MAGELESDSVALERVREYEDLPQVPSKSTKDQLNRQHLTQEADWESEVPLAENWPSTGEIKFDGCVIIPTSLLCKLTCVRYATKYRSELPCVLENFNLDVVDNEKVNSEPSC